MARRDRQAQGADVESALCALRGEVAGLGIVLSASAFDQIRIYLETLLLWNRKISLVSQSDPTEIIRKHFTDSFTAVRLSGSADSVVDLGSGAGFPGLIFAIARPEVSVCLIDANRRKASFLSEVIARANLRNARVVEGRIEQVSSMKEHRARYAVAVSRALTGIEEFLRFAEPFLLSGGRAIAMKGPRYSAEMETLNPALWGFAPPVVERYALPGGEPRFLLVFPRRAA